ncbi:MAG: hypothetical protein M0T74_05235 [Desulfitobacterium hafniense]|nr:hypothetical protein [Desulfitobacterium hafniense]
MQSRPVIDREYIDSLREIRYLGRDEERIGSNVLEADSKNIIENRGHRFEIISEEKKFPQEENYEVVGWIERTLDCLYDFIILDLQKKKYYLANLHGRSDGWPLFAMQNNKPTCSRSRMGSEWNCRLCVKYFNTVCEGR